MSKYDNAIMIAENVYWVGELMKNDAFQCHAYLIVNGKESIIIDSGSMLEYENIKRKIESIIPLKNVKYIVVHHQDPDVCANIPAFEKAIDRDDLMIVSHSRNIALIKHYGIVSEYYIIEDNDFKLKTNDIHLDFITTPYAHAPGAFTTYLTNHKILFSSDIFGAVEESWHFYAKEDYFKEIKLFHENYMPSQDILNYALSKIQALDLNLIAPQHGSLIKRQYIDIVINDLKNLKCGLYIEDSYKNSLIYKNQLLKTKEQLEHRNTKKLETILDTQEDIITATTDGVTLKYINKAFFEFTYFKDMTHFKRHHKCICELFLGQDDDKYLKANYKDGHTWIQQLIDNPNQEYYTIMKNKNNVDTLFKVDIKKFNFDEDVNNEYLVTFHDVTPYMENLDFIDIISNIKGIYFCISNRDGELLKISDSLIETLDIKDFHEKTYDFYDFLNNKDTQAVLENIKTNNSASHEIKLRYNNLKIPIMAKEFFGIINQKPVVIFILTDLTDIKSLEKESKKKDLVLLQQSKMAQMGEMVNMIAHQWRQPLNAINAASAKIVLTKEFGMLDDEELIESNHFIQNQCQKMSDVIETFLNYSKTSKEPTDFFLEDMLNNVLKLITTQFKNHNINIKVKDKNSSPAVLKGHSDMLEQVIINILMNARDAYDMIDSREEKLILITLENRRTITIVDYAGGISEKNQEKLFVPYFTTKEQGKGTGLGLYMSKRIMNEQFNGDLTYTALENGSKFTITCSYNSK